MPSEPWKYAENQFLSVTTDDDTLMSEILADHMPRLSAAATADPTFDPVLAETEILAGIWTSQETTVANAEAAQKSATLAFTARIDAIAHKPDVDTNSTLESWDIAVRGQAPYEGTLYTLLLPQGRLPFTDGTYEKRLDAIRDFGIRLAEQTGKPVLVALGTTVTIYYNTAKALRDTQSAKKAALTEGRRQQELTRIALCQQMHGTVGFALYQWKATPARIETLWDITLLRQPPQTIPAAPGAPTWAPTTRTLATTALPAGATRLAAWRLAPGGAPEMLLIGLIGELDLVIPSAITFQSGVTYQLWLQGVNARGQSDPSPTTAYTAP